jgi:TM2 domain-containing membrane protein YozV
LKNRKVAMILALISGIAPLSGFHKFYLGQKRWGITYLLLSLMPLTLPIPHIASLLELAWYLFQDPQTFDRNFNGLEDTTWNDRSPQWTQQATQTSNAVKSVEEAVRKLEKLRQDNLISELEFEEKRRILLDQIR